jgi:thiamine pyridinylase
MSCSNAFPCLVRARQGLLTLVVTLVPALMPWPADAQQTLTVALYPYVPRVDQFESAIRQAWQQVQPTVGLDFTKKGEWDGG